MKKLVALLFIFSLFVPQFSLANQAGKFSTFDTCELLKADEKSAAESAEATGEENSNNEDEDEPDCD